MYGRSFEDPDGHIWEPMWMDLAAATAAMAAARARRRLKRLGGPVPGRGGRALPGSPPGRHGCIRSWIKGERR